MKTILSTICALTLVTGCSTVVPHFDYPATSLGVYNSGLIEVGQLFLWDMKANTLTQLDPIPFPATPSTSGPTTMVASKISSISFDAGVTATVKANASAAIRNNVSIKASNAVNRTYSSVITAISKEIVRKRNEGEDVDGGWLLEQAAKPNSGLAYLIVRGVIVSDKAELLATNTAEGKLELTVPGDKGGKATIDLSREKLASCTGKESPCFINFQAYRAYINKDKNYGFALIPNVSTEKVADLLKTL
ncbi:hypothetical protein [Pleomorphomonas sp. NRK KF1]|uniref:hypothetical protein n=1 Tax=Pleomorphomonas sp. NRK KF1 TaxID=2943000 RepID=UPI002044AF62|nr:hypothetical protein [Pleomorphomonas sp. NRK KF1]MCM5555260.1 hypothetical protein [Pleomorphomonas sp. NRK KF1]